jgi:hypothetical protein
MYKDNIYSVPQHETVNTVQHMEKNYRISFLLSKLILCQSCLLGSFWTICEVENMPRGASRSTCAMNMGGRVCRQECHR